MNLKQKTLLIQNTSTILRRQLISKENAGCKQVRLCSIFREKIEQRPSLKKILNEASPLKPTPEAEEVWATGPYPDGTVFREEEDVEEKEIKFGSVILFPGQGNQFVGMANKIKKYSVVKDMFDEASEVLGYNLLRVCQEGPQEKLNRTEYCQPATFVCSLGALEMLKDEKPWAIDQCTVACGYSLGEITALTFAGCFSFGRAINLVKTRAKLMSTCCNMTEGGMMTAVYGKETNLTDALRDAREHCRAAGIDHPVCAVAIDLYQYCKVIGGHIEALNYLVENKRKYKIRKMNKLLVSGAFHTELMKEAGLPFMEVLRKVHINNPIINVYSNASGRRYKNGADVLKLLPRQIYLPVRWEQTMHRIFDRTKDTPNAVPFSFECGPGSSLKIALSKINNFAQESCYPVKL